MTIKIGRLRFCSIGILFWDMNVKFKKKNVVRGVENDRFWGMGKVRLGVGVG